MSNDARLFVAIPVPAHVRQNLQNEAGRLMRHADFKKWGHPQDYHITIKFLGETSAANIGLLNDTLRQIAGATRPFPLALGTPGIFGAPRAPHVLWMEVRGDLAALAQLHAQVERQAAALGFEPDKRPFHPHLTLARTYRGDRPLDRASLALSFPSGDSIRWQATHMTLFQSHLARVPMYEPIAELPFSAE